MAQNHNADYSEKPMTTYGRTQGPSRRYRRLRHPTFPAAEWTTKNPLLQRGEIGIESDTHKAKVGDGTTYWNSLPYAMVAETEWGYITGNISDQTDLQNALNAKQDTLTAGANIDITGTTISATDTTYTGSDGITLTGTNFTNSGVRAVASGTANGTISVNTNGTSADVSVTGLGSAAYTSSSDYATSAQGGKADTAVQPGDLATVATTGDYDDLLNKPTIPAAQVNSDWDAVSGVAQILNKPTLGTAAAADTTDFATAAQGTLASTALQPGDDITDLNNDAGYQTAGDVATAISGKQDTLTAGTNITITGTTISATDTTYSDFTGATAGDAGTNGLVPAPAAGDQGKFLQGDGTWATVDALPAQTGHSGEYLTTDGSTASWATVNTLPSQTGQSGKFLTTDGTDASWSDKPLVNAATGYHSISVGGTNTGSIYATSLGTNSKSTGNFSVSLGDSSESDGGGTIAIGYGAKTSAAGAIQLNTSVATTTNSDANTFKVANANGNFEIMSADGTIPEARLADTTGASQGDVLTLDSNGDAVWQAASGGGAVWGGITGTLSDQTDLNNALAGKADTATTLAGYGITDGANTDLSNLTATGKQVCANMSMPSSRFITLTLGVSGTQYDAPADGWFVASSQGVITISLTGNRGGITVNGAAGFAPWATLPVSKGAYVFFNYSSNQSNSLMFYYAEGAQ